MRDGFIISILLAFAAGPAVAQSLVGSSPGFHYFHKAGAGMEQHDSDLVACAVATRALVNGSDASGQVAAAAGSAGFAGGFLGAMVGSVIDNNEERQGAAANIENCMAVKGWSVISLTTEQGRAMEEPSDPAAIHEKLAPLVNATEPGGPVLRGPFSNELAVGDFVVGPAEDLKEVSISMRGVRDRADAEVDAAGHLKKPKRPKGVKAPKRARPLKAEALPAADPSKSYVVVRLSGQRSNATTIGLSRLAADGSEVVHDGAAIETNIGGMYERKVSKGEIGYEKYYDSVVDIPPGRWKLASISDESYLADLCFGAPAFELNEGDVIFIGVMSVSMGGGYPLDSSNLDVAREILAPAPVLAEKVRAPDFVNGFTSDCFGSYGYAYEVPGAPFVGVSDVAEASGDEPVVSAPDAGGAEAQPVPEQ